MKRTPLKRSTTPMKRTPLKPVSAKRMKANIERRKMLLDVYGPSKDWKCSFWLFVGAALAEGKITKEGTAFNSGECYGDVHGHETLSRARAGQSDKNLLDPEGIVLLCDYHNGWCTREKEAHTIGLADHAWERD
jgi:hypothetical protein